MAGNGSPRNGYKILTVPRPARSRDRRDQEKTLPSTANDVKSTISTVLGMQEPLVAHRNPNSVAIVDSLWGNTRTPVMEELTDIYATMLLRSPA